MITCFTAQADSLTDSCECPEYSCGACEVQESLEFYTSKCNAGTQVKSCAKPVCVAMDPLPKKCIAKSQKKPKRTIASQPKVEEDYSDDARVEAGHISQVKGTVWVTSTLGKKQTVEKGVKVYTSDTIKTDAKSTAVIRFNDSNILFINKDTEVVIEEYLASEEKKRRKAMLKLIKGQLRSSVKKKYENSQSSYYKIKTKTAVAGVRGTDFVVSMIKNTKLELQVTTLSGEVELADHQLKNKVLVPASYTASFVSPINADPESENEIGYMTPVYKVSKQQVDDILAKTSWTEIKPKNTVVQQNHVCNQPKADLNQCFWHCSNNPKGEGRCRTDLKQVRCVRQRCNANGEWQDLFRLPASVGDNCPPYGYKVDACDY